TGRLHLLAAIDRIGDGEAVPILRPVAIYDGRPAGRDVAAALLPRRAAGAPRGRGARPPTARAPNAAQAAGGPGSHPLRRRGTPGVPSTVGALEPVGASLEKK